MKLKEKLKLIYLLASFKILQAVFELGGGVFLFFVNYQTIENVVIKGTSRGATSQPGILFIQLIFKYLPYLQQYKRSAALILFLVGLYDLITGLGLFWEKNWARIVLLVTLILSLPYNLYSTFKEPDLIQIISVIAQVVFIVILATYKKLKKAE